MPDKTTTVHTSWIIPTQNSSFPPHYFTCQHHTVDALMLQGCLSHGELRRLFMIVILAGTNDLCALVCNLGTVNHLLDCIRTYCLYEGCVAFFRTRVSYNDVISFSCTPAILLKAQTILWSLVLLPTVNALCQAAKQKVNTHTYTSLSLCLPHTVASADPYCEWHQYWSSMTA